MKAEAVPRLYPDVCVNLLSMPIAACEKGGHGLEAGRYSSLIFMQNSQASKPIEIKISTVVAVSAILHQSDLSVLDSALTEMTGGAADFFDNEFAVIDVGALDTASEDIDWPALTALLKSYRLNPVAVRNASPEMESAILAHGLSLDGSSKPRQEVRQVVEEVVAAPAPEPAPVQPAPEPAAPASAMIVDMPVRAGQRIYARGCDLIIMAVVNNGAEVIADGSIHIYAQLRGRALAGASGNTNARIFAMSMEPELVSIAGIYRTFEDGFPAELKQQTAQIRLVGDRLDILPVQAANPVSRS